MQAISKKKNLYGSRGYKNKPKVHVQKDEPVEAWVSLGRHFADLSKVVAKSSSIYKELGAGERTALSKLAVQHLEETGRPLRIAIDVSIWQFQIQAGRGGSNPAVRTLYYRLVKLLSLSIQPLFVFDGPYRPSLKRGVKRAQFTASVDNYLTKILIKAFGFPYHDAPGEAEAECALLQKTGVVDAVLSEDVDTIMFGSGLSLRNWSAEGSRGNKSPSHVDVYHSKKTTETSGLDSKGMILVALMSGGDYIPAGIPHCGIKTACQAARAGFGQELCCLSEKDPDSLIQWRERLQHEIRTNESGFFQQRKRAFIIPESFPDRTVLGYYTRPLVSPREKIEKIRNSITWTDDIDVARLRNFVAEAFDWTYLPGAKHFIRSLAPALLVRKMVTRAFLPTTDRETVNTKTAAEMNLVKTILERRQHWITDGEPELRIAYVPNDVVCVDLEAEEDIQLESEGGADTNEEHVCSESEGTYQTQSSAKKPLKYDPNVIDKLWVLETFIKLGAPLLVETWEEDMKDPKKLAARKARARKNLLSLKTQPDKGTIDRFVKVTKPGLKTSSKTSGEGHIYGQSVEASNPTVAPLSLEQQARALKANRRPACNQIFGVTAQAASLQTLKRPQLSKGEPQAMNKTIPSGSSEELDTFVALDLNVAHNAKASPPLTEHLERTQQFITPRSRRRQQKHERPESAAPGEQPFPIDDDSVVTPRKDVSAWPSPSKCQSPLQTPMNPPQTRPRRRTFNADPKSEKSQSTLDRYLGDKNSPNPTWRINNNQDSAATSDVSKIENQDKCLDEMYSDSLPSPSTILYQTKTGYDNKGATAIRPENRRRSSRLEDRTTGKQRKELVMVRESLEGTWRCLEKWESQRFGSRQVYEEVSILDLTSA